MTEKRFSCKFGKHMVLEHNFYDKSKKITFNDVVVLLNDLHEERDYFERKKCEYWNKFNLAHLDNINLRKENEQLREKLKKYKEIEELKKEDFVNCHNCKHDRSVHDGVALDGMCAIKGLMNLDGYFDVEYHRLPAGTFCPYWELEE